MARGWLAVSNPGYESIISMVLLRGLLMCSRASCLGDPFCSVWRCCSPEVKKKSPAKRRPVSPGKMGSPFARVNKATSWAVRVLETEA